MPLSYKQLGKTFISGPNINIYPSGNRYTISGSAPNIGDGFTGITSIGSGNFLIASSVTSNDLVYRTLTGTNNLSIIENNDSTLLFSLTGGIGTIISGTNVGTGNSFFTGLSTTTTSNDTLTFRNILGGPNINVAFSTANDGDDIVIGRGVNNVNQISPDGNIPQPSGIGARVLSSITATRLISARTISGANGFTSSNPASPTIVLIKPTNTTASRLYISDSTSQLTTNAVFSIGASTIAIGGVAPNTSRLLLYAGTANKSQLRLEPFSTPITSPTDGDIWYTTSGNTLKFYKSDISTDFIFKDNNITLTTVTYNKIVQVTSGGSIGINGNYIKVYGFNTISSVTVSDTASETSLISSVLSTGSTKTLYGTTSIFSDLNAGKKFRFNAKGVMMDGNNDFVNLTINIKLGSTIIGTTSSVALTELISANSYFEIDYTFSVRDGNIIVGSGKIFSDTYLESGLFVGLPPIFIGIYSQNATIDTTSDQVFDCTATFDVASIANTITIYESTLEVLT